MIASRHVWCLAGVLLCLLCLQPAMGASLTVTSPNGGENWVAGTTQSITWTSTGIWSTDAAVKIELFKGPLVTAPVRTITSSCPLMGGSSSWEIDTELPAGTDYWVKVTSLGSTPVSDSTDGWLSITAAPTLTVIAPNGWEDWYTGETHEITWTQTGLSGTTVKIELMVGTDSLYFSRTIAASVAADQGSFSWTIPNDVETGEHYRVLITSLYAPAVSDESATKFDITQITRSLTVTSPSGGDTWVRGYPATIAWTQAGLEGTNVKLELFKGPLVVNPRTIAESVPAENGVFQWTVPENLAEGTDYWVRVRSLSFPSVFGNSEGWVTVLAVPITYTVTVMPTATAAPTLGPVNIIPGGVADPLDLDGDGKFEDVNGNGRKDFADITLFFNQMNWITSNEPLAAFDYNGNGRLDFADVVAVFNGL
jgi:PKD repeat protein